MQHRKGCVELELNSGKEMINQPITIAAAASKEWVFLIRSIQTFLKVSEKICGQEARCQFHQAHFQQVAQNNQDR